MQATGADSAPAQWLAEAQRLLQASYTQSSSQHRREQQRLAFKFAHRALDKRPTDQDALHLLGRIALERGQTRQAALFLDRALALAPNTPDLLYSRGHVCLALEELDHAEQYFRRTLSLEPGHFRARSALGYTLLAGSRQIDAYQIYHQLAAEHPEDPHVRTKLFECLSGLQADYDVPKLSADLIRYLQLEEMDYQQLEPITRSLLCHRYGLYSENPVPLELDRLASDELFMLALRQLAFNGPKMEELVTVVRRALLEEALGSGSLDSSRLSLATSLALHSWNNEYAYAVSPEENELLEALRELIHQEVDRSALNPEALQAPLLLLALYQPLDSLSIADQLVCISEAAWPLFLRPLLGETLYRPRQERKLAAAVISLTDIRCETSAAVREQYEEHPYPRWTSLNYHTETDYAQALQAELSGFIPPHYLYEIPIRILVAGCGTGRHALHVARYFRHAEVLAVDLCRRSLAYGQAMAERYDMRNIRFRQADILALSDFEERFQIIECSGVLHHMADPMRGWQALTGLLAPMGLIKVGLYSERARHEVVTCREVIARDNVPATEEGIRGFRQRLLNGDLQGRFPTIVASPDFYNLSGTRDLLFHVQEHRFTPPQLQSACDRLDLDFLGFVRTPAGVKQRYQAMYPRDRRLTNLENWDRFEAQHPQTFGGMYQFYCQKQP